MLNKRHLPSITALQCFEAVTRHLSFTRAAEELNLTQSAVSKQVAQLEELLQHLLFRRVRRRLQMTPAGDLYLVEVRKILTQVEMSTHYLRSYGGETEVLRVSTPSTFGARWLVQFVATRRAGRPVIPRLFWYMSVVGSVMTLSYFLFSAKQDSVGVLQNLFPTFTALYSLYLDIQHRGWKRDKLVDENEIHHGK